MNSTKINNKTPLSPLFSITEYLNQQCPITTYSDSLIASIDQQIETAKRNSTIIEGVHFSDSAKSQFEKKAA